MEPDLHLRAYVCILAVGIVEKRVYIFLIILHDMAVRCVACSDFCLVEFEYHLGHVCPFLLSLCVCFVLLSLSHLQLTDLSYKNCIVFYYIFQLSVSHI